MPPPTLNRSSCMLCKDPSQPLFMFPKHPIRMKLWLDLIGKSNWLVQRNDVYVYNNGRLCSKHFHDNAFTSTLKTKLIKFASPIDIRNSSENAKQLENLSTRAMTLYKILTGTDGRSLSCSETIVEDSSANYPPPMPTNCTPMPSNCHSSLPCPDDVEQVCTNQRTPKTKEILRLRCANSKLKRKLYKTEQKCLKESLHEKLKDHLTKRQYEFVMSQLKTGKVHPKGRRWTSKEKAYALNIFYQSSNTYKTLRKSCGLALPCRNTLKKSTGNVSKDDGFCPTLREALKMKTKEMKDEEKICTLVFDEMSIKSCLAYNAGLDKVDGFESSGTGKVATQALVFMIRGVTKNWKQAIAYYFRANTSTENWFKDTILRIIDQVMACGLKIISLVCDQGPNNRGLFKSLDVTPEKPFFYRNEEKIFAMYDVPHLVKSVRNNLQKYDVKFMNLKTNVEKKASWTDIEKFYLMDSSHKYRIAPKLKKMHIYGTGLNHMKVSLATQIFSHSVAAGLCYLNSRNPKLNALHTAEFVGKMDKIFDSLNSKSLFSPKKFACAVSKESDHISKWQKWVQWINKWKFVRPDGKYVRMPCQNGLILSLNAAIGIWEALKSNISFLMTGRLNQDSIENVFSSVRRSGGFRDNPSTLEFRSSIQNVIVNNFMKKTSSKNCEDDSDVNLLDVSKSSAKSIMCFTEDDDDDDDEGNRIDDIAREEVPSVNDIEKNVIAYVSGVLTKSLLKRSSCEDCKNLLVGPKLLDADRLLIYFKEYKETPYGLKWPTDAYLNYVVQLSDMFHNNIKFFFKKPNIRKNLCEILNNVNFDFFDQHHHHKEDVKKFLVRSFVTMMIKHTIKIHNDDRCTQDNKKRMKHVQHL